MQVITAVRAGSVIGAAVSDTLETYVHWWFKQDRPRGLVGKALQAAAAKPNQGAIPVQDQS